MSRSRAPATTPSDVSSTSALGVHFNRSRQRAKLTVAVAATVMSYRGVNPSGQPPSADLTETAPGVRGCEGTRNSASPPSCRPAAAELPLALRRAVPSARSKTLENDGLSGKPDALAVTAATSL